MNNFIIGLTNTTPGLTSMQLGNYSICAQYPGYPAGGSVVILDCSLTTLAGRYLVIQLPSTSYLSVCELQAYLEKSPTLSRVYHFALKCIVFSKS